LNAEPDRIDEMDDVGPELAQSVEERRGQETMQIGFNQVFFIVREEIPYLIFRPGYTRSGTPYVPKSWHPAYSAYE
jgi:hypothetical protein